MKKMYLEVEVKEDCGDLINVYYRDGVSFVCSKGYGKLVEIEDVERRKQPEIVRCGECVHFNKEYSGEMWCGICNGFGIDENSFCSFAEKRYVENG